MEDFEKIDALRTMLNRDYSDDFLSVYLGLAARKVLNRAFPYDSSVEEVPDCYAANQIQIAAYMINKRGAEGQTAHTENGITRQYENGDIPTSLLKDIVPKVGVL